MDPDLIRFKIPLLGSLAVIALATSVKALGQDDAMIQSGAFSLHPLLGLYAEHDDNIYTTPDNEIESWNYVISPGLLMEVQPSRQKFELEYDGEIGIYEKDTNDNYDDHMFAARAFLDLGIRHKLDIGGRILKGHDARGDGLTREADPESELFPPEPDEFTFNEIRGEYRFGANQARGRVDLELGSRDRDFDNNRDRTQFFDRTEDFAGIAFNYRFRPKAFLVLDASTKDLEYTIERPGGSLAGTEKRYRLGLTWDLTGKSIGRIRFGRVEKEFDDGLRPRFTGTSWEVDIRWLPRSYSYFDLKSSREPQETLGDGDFIDMQSYELAWTHNWSDSWQSQLSVALEDENFVGVEREEELTRLRLDVRYQMRRWLRLVFGVEDRSNSSPVPGLEYDAMMFMLGAEIGY